MLRHILRHGSFCCPITLLARSSTGPGCYDSRWIRWIHLVSLEFHFQSVWLMILSTSPSIYVVYRGFCAYGQCGNIGPTFASLTRAYAQSEILSSPTDGAFPETINYADLFSTGSYPNCATNPNVQTGSACHSQLSSVDAIQLFDQQHCYPVLGLPGGLQPPDSAWSTCGSAQQGGFQPGVFDPPRELVATNGLAPDPSAADSATPASSIRPPLPPKTGPPSLPTSATGTRKGLPTANPLQLVPSGDPPIADSASGQGQISDPTDSSDPSIADSFSGQEQNSDPIDPGPSPAGPGSG